MFYNLKLCLSSVAYYLKVQSKNSSNNCPLIFSIKVKKEKERGGETERGAGERER